MLKSSAKTTYHVCSSPICGGSPPRCDETADAVLVDTPKGNTNSRNPSSSSVCRPFGYLQEIDPEELPNFVHPYYSDPCPHCVGNIRCFRCRISLRALQTADMRRTFYERIRARRFALNDFPPAPRLVGIEPNPGPKQGPALASLVTGLVSEAIQREREKDKQIVVYKASSAKKHRRRKKGIALGGRDNTLHMVRSVAPVSSFTGVSGQSINMGIIPGEQNGLRMRIRTYLCNVEIPATGSRTQTVGYDNFNWGNNYFGSGVGYASLPWDANAFNAITQNIAGCFQMYRYPGMIKLTYVGNCATSSPGSVILFTTSDPENAVTLSSNPSSNGAYIVQALTDPFTRSFAPWISTFSWDVSQTISNEWKYVYNTSSSSVDDLRLSAAGSTTILGQGLSAQTGSEQLLGTLFVEFVLDLKHMINPGTF